MRTELANLDNGPVPAGIAQFCPDDRPEPQSGYSVDDVSRLGLVAAGLLAVPTASGNAIDWATLALDFLTAAVHPIGLHNRRGHDGRWLDDPYLGDHVGRAIWTTTVLATELAVPPDLRQRARHLLHTLEPLADELSTRSSLRATAYAVLGLAHQVPPRRDLLIRLTGQLTDAWYQNARRDWCWPERQLTDDGARLPQAMLCGSLALGDRSIRMQALACLDWYTDRVERDTRSVDLTALVEALADAWVNTHRPRYAQQALRVYRWLLGANRATTPLYLAAAGDCHDGLGPAAADPDHGVEATLAYYQATLSLVRTGLISYEGVCRE